VRRFLAGYLSALLTVATLVAVAMSSDALPSWHEFKENNGPAKPFFVRDPEGLVWVRTERAYQDKIEVLRVRYDEMAVAEAAEETQAALAEAETTLDVAASGDMAELICSIFGETCEAAVSVASCESGLDPNAVNATSGAAGLFQLMSSHWEGSFNPFDPVANAEYAYGLSDGGTNWGSWVCQP
jgi:hypothetical protein